MSSERTLPPGPWLKTPGWRAGAWLIGLVLLVWFVGWLLGDSFDPGTWKPLAVLALGVLLSVPYGWAWVKGRAPEPPPPPAIVPQATVRGDGRSTYVLVNPAPTKARYWLGRKAGDLGPLSWLLYTLFWRWPLMVGDAVLTVIWRGMTRLFGFNGGPSMQSFDTSSIDTIDYPEDLPPPGSF